MTDNQSSQDRFFPYRFDWKWKPTFLTLGVTRRHGVTLSGDGILVATYGRFRVSTPMTNVDHTEVSGPHRWYTAVGLRLSRVDDGITFGTNHRLGLCIAFKEPVPRVIGRRDHSALWVSVAEPQQLAAAIASFS